MHVSNLAVVRDFHFGITKIHNYQGGYHILKFNVSKNIYTCIIAVVVSTLSSPPLQQRM